jgi:hypothetical protein
MKTGVEGKGKGRPHKGKGREILPSGILELTTGRGL